MKKIVIAFMTTLLMFTLVGCNKKSDNNLQQQIKNKYMYFDFEDKSWMNEKYAYKLNETYIAHFTKEDAQLYSIRENIEESMNFKGFELDEDGNGIAYNFVSNPDNKYKMYIYSDGENKNELKVKLYDPQGNVSTVNGNLMTKEECENKIKNTINEIELINMIESGFGKDANLDLDKIKSDIDKARDIIYKETKENRDEIYYLHTIIDNYSELNNDNKAEYIGFIGIVLDEHGEILAMSDFIYLVNIKDLTLYTYTPGGNDGYILEKYEGSSLQITDSNDSNTQTLENDTDVSSDKMPTIKEQEKAIAKIMAEYGPSTDDYRIDISQNPIFYNGEWCYFVATEFETSTGIVKSNMFHVGSKTLENYGYITEDSEALQ